MFEQITNFLSTQWPNILKWILDSGIIVWAASSIIKWKKTKSEIQVGIKNAVDDNVPVVAQNAIKIAVDSAIQPLFTQLVQNSKDQNDALSAMVKCLALMQQDTPESKVAIVEILSNLNICSDKKVNEDVKAFILETTERIKEEIEKAMQSLNDVSEKNKQIIEQNEETEQNEVVNTYDGTSI